MEIRPNPSKEEIHGGIIDGMISGRGLPSRPLDRATFFTPGNGSDYNERTHVVFRATPGSTATNLHSPIDYSGEILDGKTARRCQ